MPHKITRALMAAALFSVAALSQAAVVSYQAALGPEATGATGSGFVTVEYDDVAQTLLINANWSGLSGTTTAAHIHCCTVVAGTGTAGIAVTTPTLPGFPTGLSTGSYTSALLNLTATATFNPAFITNPGGGTVTGAEAALIAGFESGKAYFNVHSTTFGGGEIRGFLQRVPEPATAALVALGLAGLALRRRPTA